MENSYTPDGGSKQETIIMDPLQLGMVSCELQEGGCTSINELSPPPHCLICNAPFHGIPENTQFNIFGQLKSRDESAKGSIFEKIGQILDVTLGSINLHSESICNHCLNLVARYDETETFLYALRSEVHVKFEFSARQHPDRNLKGQSMRFSTNADKDVSDITGEDKDDDEDEGISRPKLKLKKTNNKGVNASNKRPPYLCSVCNKSFRAFSHRVEHMLIHLGEKPWPCNECKKAFRTKSALKIHSMKHTGLRPYTCPDCSRSFSDRYYFDEHCRVHTGERPFECTFCRRLFARKKDLAIHKKTHTGDKPFKCVSCSKAFAVKSRLDRHLRTHSGDRPHSCTCCDKSFSRRDDLMCHLRQHTGERPFHCIDCKKSFSNKSNYLVHVRRHTGSNSFPCSFCEENFNQRSQVDKHMSEKHAKLIETAQDHSNQASNHPLSQQMQSNEGFSTSDLRALQGMPIGQVAQLAWGDGTPVANNYVNISHLSI